MHEASGSCEFSLSLRVVIVYVNLEKKSLIHVNADFSR